MLVSNCSPDRAIDIITFTDTFKIITDLWRRSVLGNFPHFAYWHWISFELLVFFTVIKLTSFWMNLNCFAPRRQLGWSRRWRGEEGVWSRVDCVKGFLSTLFLIALRKFWLCLTVLRNNYAKWSRGRERDSNMRNAVSGGLKRIKWHTASLFLCVCMCVRVTVIYAHYHTQSSCNNNNYRLTDACMLLKICIYMCVCVCVQLYVTFHLSISKATVTKVWFSSVEAQLRFQWSLRLPLWHITQAYTEQNAGNATQVNWIMFKRTTLTMFHNDLQLQLPLATSSSSVVRDNLYA